MDQIDIRRITTDSLDYWERGRVVYNLVLAVVVTRYFAESLPESIFAITADRLLGLFALAVLANVAYCAAYVPDVFAQLSGFGDRWRRHRWAVLAIGCGFAAVIARAIVIAEIQDVLRS